MNDNEKMWEQTIYEIKIGGVNGLSFRKGQILLIKGNRRIITNIIRDYINDDEVFMIFSASVNKQEEVDMEDEKITKFSKGESIYVTFDV